ncbi:helix-turn-helix domain-containing protein [Nocardia miyunensis]|uniref:helix-turn-helix domain-containing protein n=1 Tax=Nocardia miyunensis TaxID=282684 RepID=UPI00082BF37A|nr:transcriptional regulator [Nocardia miyunensis]
MVGVEWTPEQIRALREATRRSPLEFARAVGVTKRTLQLWESGQTNTVRAANKRLLHELLESAPEDVQTRFWTAIAHPNAAQVTDPVDMLVATADDSAAALSWAEASNVGPLTIADLRSNLRWATREYLKSPTLPLFRRVVETRDSALELLRGRQRPSQAAELYGIAGWSMTILGWMTTDLGRADVADRHLRAAWALADNTEDDALRGWICAARNTAASWRGDYYDAIEAATAGLAYAQTGTAALISASALAIDQARVGNAAGSNAALQMALETADRLADTPQPDTLAGPFTCSLERAGGYWADAALMNGDAAKSIEYAATAIDGFQRTVPVLRNLGSERMVRCQQIKAYLTLGDIDMAAVHLAEVVEMTPSEHRMGPLVQRIDEIAGLAQEMAQTSAAALEIGEIAAEFRADLDGLPALAAQASGE